MDHLNSAEAKLREGTEILRTGGGVHLTAPQCRALLDELEELREQFDNVMSTLHVDYEDMFPSDEDEEDEDDN